MKAKGSASYAPKSKAKSVNSYSVTSKAMGGQEQPRGKAKNVSYSK